MRFYCWGNQKLIVDFPNGDTIVIDDEPWNWRKLIKERWPGESEKPIVDIRTTTDYYGYRSSPGQPETSAREHPTPYYAEATKYW